MNAAESSYGTVTLAQFERTDALLAAAVRMIAAAGVGESPRLDALSLLSHATERPHSSFLAFPERAVPRDERLQFAKFVERRVRGEPVAYIVGTREFFSLPLRVGPDVLIPRPETELLVEAALARCASLAAPSVLDVGTGDRSERIRTYNFPQGRLTDHRINLTLYKVEDIVNGDLDDVIGPLANEYRADQLGALGLET